MKLTKIGIKFGDNDFGIVMAGFFAALLEARTDHYEDSGFTKKAFVEAYNNVIGGLYWLIQNPLTYNKDTHNQFPSYDYLKLKAENILFNEEVDAYLDEIEGWDNAEFGYVDFEKLEWRII